MRSDLLNIFSEHVVENGRNYDRLKNLVCGRNPEYDPVHGQIGEIEWDGRMAKILFKRKRVCELLIDSYSAWMVLYVKFLSEIFCPHQISGGEPIYSS